METRQLIKMLAGAVAIAAVVIAIAALIPSKAKAESTTELGVAMKGWAIAFGAGVEKNISESKTAFLNDIERLKNSKFFQYQKKGFEQGREQLVKNQEQIRQLPSRIKEGTTNLFATIGNALNKIMVGGKNNDGKDQK
jgi:peptidoglycan hydrolase CwlO-like protein